MRNNLKKITFASLVNLFSLHFPRFQPPKHQKEQKNLHDSEKRLIFAPSESTTLPVEQRTRVELFYM